MKIERKVILFYICLPFCIWAIYLGYVYFSKKASINDYFFDAPLLMVLDQNLTIINEWKRVGGNKYIEFKLSKKINEDELKKILLQKNWKIVKVKQFIFKKDNIFCEVDLNNSSIKFRWK